MANLILLQDGRAGHDNPVVGLADSLCTGGITLPRHPIATPALPKAIISLSKRLTHVSVAATANVIHPFADIRPYTTLLSNAAALICSGMNNLLVALCWRYYSNRQPDQYPLLIIYVGDPRGINPDTVDYIVGASQLNLPNYIALPTPPVKSAFKSLADELPSQLYPILMLGGVSAEYPWLDEDWLQIVTAFAQCCQRHGVTGQVGLSRRTPSLVAAMIEQQPSLIKASKETNIIQLYQKASHILVTEDSVTMLTEVIYTGRTVVSITPTLAHHNALIDSYCQRNWVYRVTPATLSDLTLTDTLQLMSDPIAQPDDVTPLYPIIQRIAHYD